MQFRTEIIPKQSNNLFNASSKIITIGSCFSNVIGDYLIENKIDCLSNPFGTVYNPFSIIKLLELVLFDIQIDESLFVERDDHWFHFDFHSNFFSMNKSDLKLQINDQIAKVHEFLRNADFLIITLGTSQAYLLKEETVVSNCHKINASNFKKITLQFEDIQKKMNQFLKKIKEFNPQINIILTVSPVRHLKETLEINSFSKSTLIITSHLLSNDYIKYFPSYELMIDDLRDYRYYKDDLLHPSEMAEKYIIQKFSEAFFCKELKEMIKDWQKIKLDLNHKVFNPNGQKYQSFLENLKNKLIDFKKYKDVSKEIEEVETKLLLI